MTGRQRSGLVKRQRGAGQPGGIARRTLLKVVGLTALGPLPNLVLPAQGQLPAPDPASLQPFPLSFYPSYDPDYPLLETDGMRVAALAAGAIRERAGWLRQCSLAGRQLPLDDLLHAAGPDWRIVYLHDPARTGIAWSGGFPSFRSGLVYWNSWLAWLVRSAPMELKLQATLDALIHAPDFPPYGWRGSPTAVRDQQLFDLDTWHSSTSPAAPTFQTTLTSPSLEYQNAWSCLTDAVWDARLRRLAPFGLCHAVWARVANDPNVSTWGTGFYFDNGAAGLVGEVELAETVPAGYSTICIPFIKHSGVFEGVTSPVQFKVHWMRGDRVVHAHGTHDLSLYPDTATVAVNGYNQTIYSAMVMPLIVYSSQSRTVRLQVWRNQSGPGVFIGRPIVIPGVGCSWAVTH